MSGREWDMIALGDIFTDLVMSGLPRWPLPGEEVVAEKLTREVGGGAAITACGLARLGHRVALFASVGADGEWVRRRVASCGVDLGLIQADEGESTAITVAVSTSEDRSFFTYAGANRCLPSLVAGKEAVERLARARHVHIASALDPELLIGLTTRLQARGTTVSLDVGWVESWLRDDRSHDALRAIDLFMPNEREGKAITGESDPERMLAWFAGMGLRRVALKLGGAGSMLLDQGEIIRGLPCRVSPVETTGAGDCFDAGLISGMLRGEPREEWLRTGNICGALSTTAPGGITGFPSPEELRRLKGD